MVLRSPSESFLLFLARHRYSSCPNALGIWMTYSMSAFFLMTAFETISMLFLVKYVVMDWSNSEEGGRTACWVIGDSGNGALTDAASTGAAGNVACLCFLSLFGLSTAVAAFSSFWTGSWAASFSFGFSSGLR